MQPKHSGTMELQLFLYPNVWSWIFVEANKKVKVAFIASASFPFDCTIPQLPAFKSCIFREHCLQSMKKWGLLANQFICLCLTSISLWFYDEVGLVLFVVTPVPPKEVIDLVKQSYLIVTLAGGS